MSVGVAQRAAHEYRCRKCGVLFFCGRLPPGAWIEVICHRSKCKHVNIYSA